MRFQSKAGGKRVNQFILQLSVAAAVDLGLGEQEQNRLVSWMQKAYDMGRKHEREDK